MRRPDPETVAKFGDLFTEYKVLNDSDKVRKNSRDDYGLGAGWYFMTGRHVDGDFTVVYVRPEIKHTNQWRNHMCEGNIGACELYQRPNDRPPVLVVSDRLMIASYKASQVTDIPDDVLALL